MLRRLGLATVLVGLVIAGRSGIAAADVNDFTITNFDAQETLTRDDPQGSLHIIEHINVDFTDQNHGILRAIPKSYKGHPLKITVHAITSDSGAPSQYSTYTSNGNLVLRIGDPNRTVTGSQEYTVDYTVQNVITFYNNHDELYWDINGTQWGQPTNHVSVVLTLPSGVHLLDGTDAARCYTGLFGSTTSNCMITQTTGKVVAETNQPLGVSEGLTIVTGFQKGYFQPYTWRDWVTDHAGYILSFAIPFLVLAGGSGLYWFKRGRDAKGTGIIVPQYDAPDGLKPIEVGEIADFKVDNRDITATIIGLAVKKYIRIIEKHQDKLIGGDKVTYQLQLLTDDMSQLDDYEKQLLPSLFSGATPDGVVDLSASKNKLYLTAATLKDQVSNNLTSAGYFKSNPAQAGKTIVGLVVGMFLAFVYFFHSSNPYSLSFAAGSVLGGAIALLFGLHIAARTAKGVAAKEHIEGLKLYMDVAEKDRLEKLQGPNAAYAASKEPVKTVELFEKLLPYAVALGVEKGWAAQFTDLYKTPPDWYAGNWTAFNAGYLVGSIGDGMNNAINTAFTAPSSSGSSGFGGGGFSGGGGGGGGGGGW